MPLYPYRCTECGHRFEKIQSFSSAPETVCPNCGKAALERILTAPGLQFKGAGWYINDYSSKGSSSSESSTSGTTEKPASDAKPAATESSSKPAASEAATKPAAPSTPAASN
ncbi:MAG: zinc ribbon domain-containing protein [Acidobacteriota bacterium]|nr:zinc ribbon domain-containing protein [Acidobacteriota bacterium]